MLHFNMRTKLVHCLQKSEQASTTATSIRTKNQKNQNVQMLKWEGWGLLFLWSFSLWIRARRFLESRRAELVYATAAALGPEGSAHCLSESNLIEDTLENPQISTTRGQRKEKALLLQPHAFHKQNISYRKLLPQ